MLERLPELAAADPALERRGRHLSCRFLAGVGADEWLVEIREGRVERVERALPGRSWTFAIRAPADAWAALWRAMPAPQENDIMALVKHRRMSIEGELQPFFANLLYFKTLLALPRGREPGRERGR